ncbi:MAG: hypothetical protein AAFN74_11950 [Myxococcota bacterium]
MPRHHGRAVLLGDAAGTVRPHTTVGTSKAFGDATVLGVNLRGWTASHPLPDAIFSSWAKERSDDLYVTSMRVMALAQRSGLGVLDAPEPWSFII